MTMTFTTLTGARGVDESIKNWMVNSAVPSEHILTLAQNAIYDEFGFRVREMVKSFADTISTGNDFVALPARFLSCEKLYYTGVEKDGRGITKRTMAEVEDAFEYDAAGARVDGKPRLFYADGSNFNFERPADKDYAVRGPYFERPAPLASSSNETNLLTDKYSWLLKSTCLWQAYLFAGNNEKAREYERMARSAVASSENISGLDEGYGLIADAIVL